MDGRSYVKIPLIISAVLNVENVEKYCFLWSILACLHPCNNNQSKRSSNYRQYFFELNIEDFDFAKGFKCSLVQRFEKLSNSSIKHISNKSYQDKNKWKHNLIPIEISKNELKRIELLNN